MCAWLVSFMFSLNFKVNAKWCDLPVLLKGRKDIDHEDQTEKQEKNTVVVTPVKPKELSTGPTYIYKNIHVSIAHLAFWSAHTISEDDFSIKPVYKLPAEQNAHPNQLMQEGLEMQRSNHLCSIRTASGAGSTAWIWAVGPWWCSMKSWTTAKVGAPVSTVAGCLQLREHTVALGQWDIADLLFLMKALNPVQQSSEAICVCRFSSWSSQN